MFCSLQTERAHPMRSHRCEGEDPSTPWSALGAPRPCSKPNNLEPVGLGSSRPSHALGFLKHLKLSFREPQTFFKDRAELQQSSVLTGIAPKRQANISHVRWRLHCCAVPNAPLLHEILHQEFWNPVQGGLQGFEVIERPKFLTAPPQSLIPRAYSRAQGNSCSST